MKLADVQRPPRTPRLTLWAGGCEVGSVEPRVLHALHQATPSASGGWPDLLQKLKQKGGLEKAPEGDLNQSLSQLADRLRACGCCGPWRHERLPVFDAQGRAWAEVERGVVRVLGFRTQAVHLVGWRPDGCLWVQQRSWQKPNDPGLWDTLMGGTVSAGETLDLTLARETWEEAGLHLHTLPGLQHGGSFTATRPVPDGDHAGYLVEDTHWFTVTVPADQTPVNQDGEVDHFEAWTPAQVAEALAQGRFTPEAHWVLVQVLAQTLASPPG